MGQIPRSTERISSLSIHYAQQPRNGWPSNVFRRFCRMGKASTIDIEISLTPHLIFTEDQKCEIWRRFQHYWTFETPAFENAARYPNSETKMQCCDDAIIALSSRS